jgi:hypothetical protein
MIEGQISPLHFRATLCCTQDKLGNPKFSKLLLVFKIASIHIHILFLIIEVAFGEMQVGEFLVRKGSRFEVLMYLAD